LKLPTVSKHLKVLQRAGLISQGRKAQWRPCRLEPAALKDVSEWVEKYRHVWEERNERLDGLLRELQTGAMKARRPKEAQREQGQSGD
jgi:DNA-binding transcriptional ArsR family regulator